MVTISREDLHALVWSKPMTEIAREFGVRDQHIAQACDAYDIARPRPGHWQRIEHGKAADTSALSNDKYPSDETVIVGPTNGTEPQAAVCQTS